MSKSRRKMHDEAKADPVPRIADSANSEKKPIPLQESYKMMLQKRLYELESESMPAT